MTWTYNSTLLGSTSSTAADLMRVRYLAQDVTSSTQLVQDEEIYWVLDSFPNVWEAASVVAGTIGTHFAKKASSKSVGGFSIAYSERAQHFEALSMSLKKQAKDPTLRQFTPYSGGISISDKEEQVEDTDWNQPSFRIGQTDYPGIQQRDWVQEFPNT